MGSGAVMRRDSCVDFGTTFVFVLVFLLIYFLTGLLPDLSIYVFQNKPVPFQAGGRRR